MKLLQIIKEFFSLTLNHQNTRLDEYIAMKRPQNNADLERIVREYNDLRMW
jgi:hypothetical protein